jgi:flagellar motility protein MotE (MotC chaperone)
MNQTNLRPTGRKQPPVAARKAKSNGRANVKPRTKTKGALPDPFPIVGIGASAGGLEALEQFFRNVPTESGLGFVVVQHLDPTHKGILVELLQRTTPMSVVQATDPTKVERNHVYVIPPNKDLSIFGGVLHLLEPAAKRGLRLPIDFFLSSLADDAKERSIGVVLSGMGSDGAQGLRAIFAPQNLVMHPPFTKIDVLTCRNLLIYLDAELQQKLMSLFHYSLNPGGVLVLGSSETIGAASDLFTPLPGKVLVYQRLDNAHPADLSTFPFALTRPSLDSPSATQMCSTLAAPSMQSLADQLLLQRYSPAAVLVTSKGDILYISGRTGKYLEPAAGKVNWNLFAMRREGLGDVLSEGFRRALRRKAAVVLKQVAVGKNGGAQIVDITIQPVAEPEALRGMVMIVFSDVAQSSDAKASRPERAGAPNARAAELAKELRQAKGELQANRDEMQTSQEELRSTNEEMQSMNEELQSTNEELTTSKEEMQSMNEEMQAVNQEMQSKLDPSAPNAGAHLGRGHLLRSAGGQPRAMGPERRGHARASHHERLPECPGRDAERRHADARDQRRGFRAREPGERARGAPRRVRLLAHHRHRLRHGP